MARPTRPIFDLLPGVCERDMRGAMAPLSPSDSAPAKVLRAKLAGAWRARTLSLKAVSFALIGVVNTAIDYSVFLLAREAFERSPAALAAFAALATSCHCGAAPTILLIGANVTSWTVAVSGSYIMNSSITFAAESGRRLRWRHYLAFIVAGIIGLVANTATLVFAAQVWLLPVYMAKALAILASFVVNFSLSHFVVFRVRAEP
jgi:putative flippase GtrA